MKRFVAPSFDPPDVRGGMYRNRAALTPRGGKEATPRLAKSVSGLLGSPRGGSPRTGEFGRTDTGRTDMSNWTPSKFWLLEALFTEHARHQKGVLVHAEHGQPQQPTPF